jgi:hypothetical protein
MTKKVHIFITFLSHFCGIASHFITLFPWLKSVIKTWYKYHWIMWKNLSRKSVIKMWYKYHWVLWKHLSHKSVVKTWHKYHWIFLFDLTFLEIIFNKYGVFLCSTHVCKFQAKISENTMRSPRKLRNAAWWSKYHKVKTNSKRNIRSILYY